MTEQAIGDDIIPRAWNGPGEAPVGCLEKVKVPNETVPEMGRMCQDALDDAVLMGCDEIRLRSGLIGVLGASHDRHCEKAA